MTSTGKPLGEKPDNNSPPLAQELKVGESTLNKLPILTEIVVEGGNYLPRLLSAQEIQLLLPRLEAQIETLFTKKLGQHLEQLQRQAIEQSISELKDELPELLHDALYAYLDAQK